jgi:hypothetical protein
MEAMRWLVLMLEVVEIWPADGAQGRLNRKQNKVKFGRGRLEKWQVR